jgi:HSP20 family protein
MALVRWAPSREINAIQDEVNRLFGSFFDNATPLAPTNRITRGFVPAIDIVENGDGYVLHVDLPGMSEQDVKLEVLDGVLTISGERKTEHDEKQDGYRRIERLAGSFSRSLVLPEGVSADSLSASFDNGVLTITVPKPPEVKPQPVQINVANGEKPAVAETVEASATE